jgi:hypothetical protein
MLQILRKCYASRNISVPVIHIREAEKIRQQEKRTYMNLRYQKRRAAAFGVVCSMMCAAVFMTNAGKQDMAEPVYAEEPVSMDTDLQVLAGAARVAAEVLDASSVASVEPLAMETVMAAYLDESVEAAAQSIAENSVETAAGTDTMDGTDNAGDTEEEPIQEESSADTADTVPQEPSGVDLLDIEDAGNYRTVPDASSIELPPQTIYTIPSVDMTAYSGKTIQTDELTVDIEAIRASYATEESPKWDSKKEFAVVNTIYHFLTDQMGVSPSIAAGMCGNFYAEGYFGMEQSTYHVFTDYEDAVARLSGSVDRGYGIVQWTSKGRRQNILNYYTAVYNAMPDEDFETVMMTAELCCAYEEVKYSRDIFSDMGKDLSVEDATGRIALLFERYKDCTEDWSQSGHTVSLVRDGSSGAKRLKYAEDIYKHFNK